MWGVVCVGGCVCVSGGGKGGHGVCVCVCGAAVLAPVSGLRGGEEQTLQVVRGRIVPIGPVRCLHRSYQFSPASASRAAPAIDFRGCL